MSGPGRGIGLSVARRFAAAGMPAGLIARTAASTGATRAALAATGVTVAEATADAGQDDQLTAALDAITGQLGLPGALVYNAGLIRHDRPGELSREQYVTAYAINVLGAMTAAVHLAPAMAQAGGGSILITGGMPVPEPGLTSLSLGKAGIRALTTLLAGQYGPAAGIHVATVTVADAVAPGGPLIWTASPKSTGACTARGRTTGSTRCCSRGRARQPFGRYLDLCP